MFTIISFNRGKKNILWKQQIESAVRWKTKWIHRMLDKYAHLIKYENLVVGVLRLFQWTRQSTRNSTSDAKFVIQYVSRGCIAFHHILWLNENLSISTSVMRVTKSRGDSKNAPPDGASALIQNPIGFGMGWSNITMCTGNTGRSFLCSDLMSLPSSTSVGFASQVSVPADLWSSDHQVVYGSSQTEHSGEASSTWTGWTGRRHCATQIESLSLQNDYIIFIKVHTINAAFIVT